MSSTFSRILCCSLIYFLLTALTASAAPPKGRTQQPQQSLIYDTDTQLDINNLLMFIYNDGNFAYDKAIVMGKTDGLYFPRGTMKTVVYSAGIWVGAKVNGDIRLAISEYGTEFVPGPMESGTFLPDRPEFRVYKIHRGDTPGSNPDYGNWPVDQGAPVDGDGEPAILGDQMTWSVFNDSDPSQHFNNAAATEPLGIEIQNSCFGYGQQGPMGQVYFLKYRIINKGNNTLDSAFVSIWADPDLGNASDDLVGCDTILSLGYCYNEGDDATYGPNPPAVGFDFLQGPIVPAGPDDSALVNGTWRHGFKNLPMTSFNKYINGTDPASLIETYGYMCGLTKGISGNMVPLINPVTSEPTMFAVSGNPVTMSGWIDEAAADRRLMLSAGPFTMAPGDTQEVVTAVLVGQGSSPLSSITVLRLIDNQVQATFGQHFDIPTALPVSSVYSRDVYEGIELFWSGELVGDVQYNPVLNQEFHFEGFNVYQGQTEYGPWKKIATYDEINEVALIYADVPDPDAGGIQRIIVQSGTNSGLQFYRRVTHDAFTSQPLVSGETYHFAVSGYFYDALNMTEFRDLAGNFLGYLTQTLESPLVTTEGTPLSAPISVTDTAAHVAGRSDGLVLIEWLDPLASTGHDYRVTFDAQKRWRLQDLTTGFVLLNNQENQSGDYDYPVLDGFMIRVISPAPGVRAVQEVANAYGPLAVPDNVNYSLNSTGDWYMDPLGDRTLARYHWRGATNNDYEIRVKNSAGTHVLDFLGHDEYANVLPYLSPIEFWDIGSGTPDDPSDDRQICYMNLDDGTTFPDVGWGDGLYIWDINYDDVPWTQPGWHTGLVDPETEGLHLGRFRFEDGSGNYTFVPAGTIVRITTNKTNTVSDVFEFSTGFACGDVTQNKQVDIADVVFLINYIFVDGAAPAHIEDADVDCNTKVNISDCVYMINYIFAGGMVPCAACSTF